jgi:hypothetical protein
MQVILHVHQISFMSRDWLTPLGMGQARLTTHALSHEPLAHGLTGEPLSLL